MPLNTQIVRDGENLKMPGGWKGFHITAMLYAIAFERDLAKPNDDIEYPLQPQGISPRNVMEATDYTIIAHVCPGGRFKLSNLHNFVDTMDGEVFTLKPGDELQFWRSRK